MLHYLEMLMFREFKYLVRRLYDPESRWDDTYRAITPVQ